MSYHFFNPNPLGKFVGDCTIRAICAVTGLDWYEIHRQQSDLSRIMADMPSSDDVWWELLRLHGFRKVKLLDSCPDCYTVADFAYDHPIGLYVLGPKEHAIAIIDGDWYDTWDSGATVPLYYLRREKYGR